MIKILAAIDQNRGLAKGNSLPWNLPNDVKRYRELMKTEGGNVLIGRTTYMQMKNVLGDNKVFLATTSIDSMNGVEIVKDINNFLSEYKGDLWVIGGAKVFEDSLPYVNELMLTRIDGDFDCNVFFPEFEDKFEEYSKEEPITENGITYQFVNYRRITS
jgi:dihydrofolate reductase